MKAVMELFIALFVALFLAPAAWAADPAPDAAKPLPDPDPSNPETTYKYCLDLARSAPEKGFLFAGRWLDLKGGEPARHCQAQSLIALKDFKAGARRLEELAQQTKTPAYLRAAMLAQAAQAWLLDGNGQRAYEAQTAGLELVTKGTAAHADLLVDRAMTLAGGQKYREAVDDLALALSVRPNDADALAFRASAHRRLDAMDAALADAELAVKADPNNLNALLERAAIYRQKNRLTEARLDWVALIQLAPESEAAEAARTAIAELDLKN